MLAGYHQPDDNGAQASVNGSPLTLGDGAAAAAAGIRFVHQDLGLVGSIALSRTSRSTAGYQTGVGRHILWREEVNRTRDALAGLGLSNVDVKAPVDALPPAQRTAVAIARALVGWENGATLLVLDEPTATLPGDDVKRLFEVIHRLKERGVSILYVSHHLDEVFELADRVTVLRDGKRVTTVPVARSRPHGSRRAHRRAQHRDHERDRRPPPTPRRCSRFDGLQGGTVHGVDFDVAAGEIVGLAGITGSGREHVLGLDRRPDPPRRR